MDTHTLGIVAPLVAAVLLLGFLVVRAGVMLSDGSLRGDKFPDAAPELPPDRLVKSPTDGEPRVGIIAEASCMPPPPSIEALAREIEAYMSRRAAAECAPPTSPAAPQPEPPIRYACPKCGNALSTSLRYMLATAATPVDYLQVSCGRCTYSWRESCRDAEVTRG